MLGQLWMSYSKDNPRFGVAKTPLFLVPGITQDSQDNLSFKNRALDLQKIQAYHTQNTQLHVDV